MATVYVGIIFNIMSCTSVCPIGKTLINAAAAAIGFPRIYIVGNYMHNIIHTRDNLEMFLAIKR